MRLSLKTARAMRLGTSITNRPSTPRTEGGGATDPNFSSVVSLLHFDGTNGSTTFTDVKGKTWTGQGNAQISTGRSKWGTASLLLDGTGDYLVGPSSADWQTGTNNFTVEGWVYITSNGDRPIASCAQASSGTAGGGWNFYATHTNGSAKMRFFDVVSSTGINGATVVTTNAWHHVAVTRSGNTFRLFLDGVLDGSGTITSAYNNLTTMLIGAARGPSPTQMFQGSIDDFRFTKGVARYTANFTPSTSAFPDA